LEKVEEKGAYGGKAPVENKIAFRKSEQKSIRGGFTGALPPCGAKWGLTPVFYKFLVISFFSYLIEKNENL
jgi:hypothetical protein